MNADDNTAGGDGRLVGSRWPELVTALALMGIAGLVIADSLRVGQGWADDGPQSGYFPFYIGVILMAAAGSIAVSTLWRWRRADPLFAEGGQLRRVAQVLVPTVLFVIGIATVGLYVASLLLIGWFMRQHGTFRWPATALVAIGVPLVVYVVFERWFLVLLPKGPLERLMGL